MINNISLKNFRLFEDINLNTNNSLVILSGKNATGKTSILESIYLCSTSKSHRTDDLNNLILNNKDFSICEIKTDKKYKMVLSKDGKKSFINKQEIKKISDFIGNLNVVMFSPNDLNLINGSKHNRRHFLDLEISLLDKSYLKASTAYKRILKERNELLKNQNIDMILLDIYTKELCEYLDYIYKKRISFLEDINKYLDDISMNLGINKIKLKYQKTYEDDLLKSFKNKEKLDILTKVTNIGSHRDDILIYLDDKIAINYASEGQKRIICIAIKLALKEYIKNNINHEPILLLDDVFAALDNDKIRGLINYVKNSKQVFITTTSILEVPDELLKNALVLRI